MSKGSGEKGIENPGEGISMGREEWNSILTQKEGRDSKMTKGRSVDGIHES